MPSSRRRRRGRAMARAERRAFADRAEAGLRLARRLVQAAPADPVVYALPRGGVPVAAEIAAALDAPLDLILVRKIGAPHQPELALGAVVDGGAAETVMNDDVVDATGADAAFIAAARVRELSEIQRRRAVYLAGRLPVDCRGRTAIVVDDGIATGATARAALRGLRRRGAARLVVAVPVASPMAAAVLRREADELICLVEADLPAGIGGFYDDFHQLNDAEVVALLATHRTGG